jgi:hypothetical protein
LIIKAAADDEEDKGMTKFAAFLLINQLNRVQTDFEFYTNPMAIEQISKNIMPAFSTVSKAYKLIDSSMRLIMGDSDELQSGPYEGHTPLYRDFIKAVPISSQLARMMSYGEMDFQANNILTQAVTDDE